MAGLIKIKGTSLIENLVATALLTVIFSIAAYSLHHFFQKNFNPELREIQVDFEQHYYQYCYGKIKLPLQYTKNNLYYDYFEEKQGKAHDMVLTVKDASGNLKYTNKRALQNIP